MPPSLNPRGSEGVPQNFRHHNQTTPKKVAWKKNTLKVFAEFEFAWKVSTHFKGEKNIGKNEAKNTINKRVSSNRKL